MSDWLRWLLIAPLLVGAVVVAVLGRARGRRRAGRLTAGGVYWPSLGVRRTMAVSVLGWLLVALVVAASAGGGLLWFLGWPQLPKSGQFDVTQLLDLLKIALSVVAGFGGVVLLAVNYRKQRVAEDEHALAVRKADREVVQKFNERLGAAAEQLAHESPAVRLTGVYALTGLADDWDDQRQVCIDVLCGYLRLQAKRVPGEDEVRQAILRMIRERTSSRVRRPSWSALDFDFTGIKFENADFARLIFSGTVTFDRAEFDGEITSFANTIFQGTLSCHGTRFLSKTTTFEKAGFSADAVEFVGAEFVGEKVDFSDGRISERSIDFYRCRFAVKQVSFSYFLMTGGGLRWERCTFDDLELDLSLAPNWLEWWDVVKVSRFLIEECHLTRCRVDFGPDLPDPKLFWLRDTVLDAVTFRVGDEEDVRPWLNVHRLETRGGTELPEDHLRHI